MITKFVFEETDFQGAGQMIIRESATKGIKDPTFGATVSYKIGWMPGKGSNTMAMISLADGMIITFKSTKALCDKLNSDQCGYRPMTDDEITKVMVSQHNRFRNNGGV
jgi:hypothetical protein